MRWLIGAFVLLTAPLAFAQHANDNAVVTADDAFGITLGTETIGLYYPDSVRGFNPQTAGNARIGGLYFDQQVPLSPRVLEGSTIRVGINTIGYAFPAPTGIVDYDLRHLSDVASLTSIVDAGPFDAWGVDIDGQFPLKAANLKVPIGISNRVDAVIPGGTIHSRSFGTAPQWTPREGVVVRAFYDRREVRDEKLIPQIYLGEAALPPEIPARYLGQTWEGGAAVYENFGALTQIQLARSWNLAAGVFRSVDDNPRSFADLYVNTLATGQADHLLLGFPGQRLSSTSGEVRVTGRFADGPRVHEVVFLARGRDAVAIYGGADLYDAGMAVIGQAVALPEPAFNFAATTRDHNSLISAGLAYHGAWLDRGQLSLGVLKTSYRKNVSQPGTADEHSSDGPWRLHAAAAYSLSRRLHLYAGFTQGLEDAGVAPSNADNRGAILPATRTWQRDAGLKYAFTSRLQLIAGVFDVHKPYFNLDAANSFVALGQQRHKGFELSLAGEITAGLNVVAGVEALNAGVSSGGAGAVTGAAPFGPLAVGQNNHVAQINVDYQLPQLPVVSLDLTLSSYGRRPGSLDNRVSVAGGNYVDFGIRFRFRIFGAASSLRVVAQNMGNTYNWTITDSGGFSPGARRSFQGYLITDL